MTLPLPRRIRVLIVDDSSTMRMLLSRAIGADPRFEVVGQLRTAEEALEHIQADPPDVLSLDLELPGMSGIELLRTLRQERPVPAVVVSSRSTRGAKETLEALEAGAIDVIAKPADGSWAEMMLSELRTKLAIAAAARVSRIKRAAPVPLPPLGTRIAVAPSPVGNIDLIAIGASTGGPTAVQTVVTGLPANSPPVVIVIHMPGGFTRSYAERLNELSRLSVTEAQDGQVLLPGHAVVAPGGRQFRVKRRGPQLVVALGGPERISGHSPSVDVMFESVAQVVGRRTAACILTGMGADGAQGLLQLRQKGARTFAQDEASCVVFGMPKAAWDLKAAEALVPIDQMARRLSTV